MRLDADARVADLDGYLLALAPRAQPNPAAGRRKLDRILEQIPEHLLQPGRIGLDHLRGILKIQVQLHVRGRQVGPANLDRAPQNAAEFDRPLLKLQLAARNARYIEEVVDQAGLELDVAGNDVQRFPRFRVELAAPLEHGRRGQHRCQRRAQLVRQDRQEVVLGLVGVFRRGLGALGAELAAANSCSTRFFSVISRLLPRMPRYLPSTSYTG